jgi:hypothetical protein
MRGLALALVALAAAGTAVASGAASVSPDREWSFTFSRLNGYGRIDVRDRSTNRLYRMYRSNDACCDQITWIAPHTLVFVDDYRVLRLDPDSRTTRRLAGFSSFVVSPSGRFVAGFADTGGHAAETVYVVPVAGGRCLVVPRRPSQDDSDPAFSADSKTVQVLRRRFDAKLGEAVGATRTVRFRLAALRSIPRC